MPPTAAPGSVVTACNKRVQAQSKKGKNKTKQTNKQNDFDELC